MTGACREARPDHLPRVRTDHHVGRVPTRRGTRPRPHQQPRRGACRARPPAPAGQLMIIGIDPGATGAIALLDNDGQLLEVHDMPYADGAVLAPVLAELLLTGRGSRRALVERAQSMPGMGVSGAFRYGTGYGVVLGVLGALSIPVETVHPSTWKRAMGLNANKGACRRRAVEVWPDHAALFARAKDDGRAEAALLARHAWHVRAEVA